MISPCCNFSSFYCSCVSLHESVFAPGRAHTFFASLMHLIFVLVSVCARPRLCVCMSLFVRGGDREGDKNGR